MSGTTTKTDIKEETKAALQKKVDVAVQVYVKAERKLSWELADLVQEMTQQHFYTRQEAQTMLRKAFCKAHNLSLDTQAKSASPEYNSFSVTVVRLGLVGSLSVQAYQEVRNSGRSLTAVWAKMMGDGGKLERKIENMKNTNIGSKEELGEDMEETKMAKREEPTSWIASEVSGGYNGGKAWIKEGREIARTEPNVLIQFLQSLMNKNLLDDALRKTLIGILED